MRSKIKMWRNDRGGRWDSRITWYDEGKDKNGHRINIRLKVDTVDGVRNLYPNSEEEADVLWEEFRENNQRPKDSPAEDISPNPFFEN